MIAIITPTHRPINGVICQSQGDPIVNPLSNAISILITGRTVPVQVEFTLHEDETAIPENGGIVNSGLFRDMPSKTTRTGLNKWLELQAATGLTST